MSQLEEAFGVFLTDKKYDGSLILIEFYRTFLTK
jgi:hypothetical protein